MTHRRRGGQFRERGPLRGISRRRLKAPQSDRRERSSRAVREAPDSAPRGRTPAEAMCHSGRLGTKRPKRPAEPDVPEPAGGTTTRSSAGRAGCLLLESVVAEVPKSGQAAGEAELAKAYRSSEVETAVYGRWLDADVFAPDGAGSRADWTKQPFVIIQPPPNVTGSLHLGHAQRSTVEDLMTRHARMQGRPALFLPGLDHASIAAQYVLDKILAKKGQTRQSLGRDKYLEAMWEFVNETRQTILSQQRRVGASLDWGRLRFTMDEVSAKAVREAFLRLYREGLAYRTEALIHWCPGCRTSVSDLEVVPKETTGSLWTMRYHLIDEVSGSVDPDAWIAVATTRPETLLGDPAVAVTPDDTRYNCLLYK